MTSVPHSETDFFKSPVQLGLQKMNLCDPGTVVGAGLGDREHPHTTAAAQEIPTPVFNRVPAAGEPARFGLFIEDVPVILNTRVPAGGGYGVEVLVANLTEAAQILSTQVTFWGVPGDPAHDASRGWDCLAGGYAVEGTRPCGGRSTNSRRARC